MNPRNLIAMVSFLVVLAAPSVIAQEVVPVEHLAMLDANDRFVGMAIDATADNAKVAINIDGHLLILDARPQSLNGDTYPVFEYEAGDCSSTPYLRVQPYVGDGFFPKSVVCRQNANTSICPTGTQYVYYPVAGTEKTITAIASKSGTSDTCAGHPPMDFEVVEVIMLVDLAQLFTAPFRIEANESTGAGCCDDVAICLEESKSFRHFMRCMSTESPE
ncbi:hypothetical protein ACFLU6_11565 [Acidobacteriota bacterium]